MTCQERWLLIEPGSTVEFSGGRRFITLADQWDRYTGINDHSVVEIGGTGFIAHVSYYCDMHETYKDQFRIAT